ncbi:MAG TPA: Dyp-type peroxidase [Steroidobacteraceae bacterium]|nr:Dyp-type peroxidase [Steroidobacteraceae bacterium]
MSPIQPGILAPIPRVARHLSFTLAPDAGPGPALERLAQAVDPAATVVGLGRSISLALGRHVPGLRDFPSGAGRGFEIPATPGALWCWLRGEDRGELVHRSRALQALLAPAFALDSVVDAFMHEDGRDLTGYEDGTENPTGERAVATASLQGAAAGLDGSSYAAVQQWVHDFAAFEALGPDEQDLSVGRRRADNEEIDEAPPSAHVKRTAQESFSPEAFVLRRSMPWAEGAKAGLVFLAFGRSFDAFEAQLSRMTGLDDGITDALFRFTRPVTGAYYWCPPVSGGRLDLRALELR